MLDAVNRDLAGVPPLSVNFDDLPLSLSPASPRPGKGRRQRTVYSLEFVVFFFFFVFSCFILFVFCCVCFGWRVMICCGVCVNVCINRCGQPSWC